MSVADTPAHTLRAQAIRPRRKIERQEEPETHCSMLQIATEFVPPLRLLVAQGRDRIETGGAPCRPDAKDDTDGG